ncbi:hypothetical protein RJ55_04418 [Drechmeria coniospora]|nr:hypothetical protein RJ55_04418 [Drechmeria coniospora]
MLPELKDSQALCKQPTPQIIATNHRHESSPRIIATNHRHESSPQIIATNHRHKSSPQIIATTHRHNSSPQLIAELIAATPHHNTSPQHLTTTPHHNTCPQPIATTRATEAAWLQMHLFATTTHTHLQARSHQARVQHVFTRTCADTSMDLYGHFHIST